MAQQQSTRAAEPAIGVPALVGARRERSMLARLGAGFWRFCRHKPLGAAGGLLLLLLVVLALGAGVLSPQDPLTPAPLDRLGAPSLAHPFGTDHIGRDMLSRIIHGARPSLYTGLLVVTISSVIGLVIGVSSGYLGGRFDLIVQRLVDGLMAIPRLVFAMAMLTVFSSGIQVWKVDLPLVWKTIPLAVVVALSVLLAPTTVRVLRATTLSLTASPWVEAAQSTGASSLRIIFRHLAPNVMAPLIVIASAQLGSIILIEASLSFLGLGLPPPHPSWGGMLQSSGRQYMQAAPWLAIFPGLAISLGVLGFNLFGDALRDVLDPRLRGTG